MNSQSSDGYMTNDRSVTKGIRGRLFLGFGAIILILAFAISFILYKVTITENLSRQVLEIDLSTHDTFYDLTLQIYQSQLFLSNWILTRDKSKQDNFNKSWKITDQKIDIINSYSKSWGD